MALFTFNEKTEKLRGQLEEFMTTYIYPNERRFHLAAERLGPWRSNPVIDELKPLARNAGLWNLFFTG